MNHRPRKRFGQNFLQDRGVIRRIAAAIAPQPDQTLVEIGPGEGALTQELLSATEKLQAIELDRDLIDHLTRLCAPLGKLSLHNADALRFDFRQLYQGQPLRVVGNLPYNISTPILFRLLAFRDIIQDMHFMLQKEVVDRMAAEPGGKDYGRLSVMLQAQCEVCHLFDIGPEAFRPPPKVDSSFVRLVSYAEPPYPISDFDRFSRLVTAAFAQRRKTLRNNLKGLITPEAISDLGIDPGARAETLGIGDFVRLAECLPAS